MAEQLVSVVITPQANGEYLGEMNIPVSVQYEDLIEVIRELRQTADERLQGVPYRMVIEIGVPPVAPEEPAGK